MDKTILVDNDIEEGKKLILALDEAGFEVNAAMWFYVQDSSVWRLFLASTYVEEEGPKKSYSFIQNELKKLNLSKISLKDISILSTNHPLINLIKAFLRTGPGISGIRFTKNVINNILIEDAYIYRMN